MNVVRVLPDVPAIDKAFDYLVPDDVGGQVRVGTMVRVPLAGRRVAGWVLEVGVEPPDGVKLSRITKVVGEGPSAEMIDLCRWVAWRWAGRLATVLRAATPQRVVASVPPLRVRPATDPDLSTAASAAFQRGAGVHVVEVSPTTDPLQAALVAASSGQALVITPSVASGERLVRGLRQSGAAVARWPWDWQAAASGATIVGGRSAAFAPAPALSAVVVLDEHDEGLQNESSPTWNARDVAVERARRAGVPCLLVSPCPSIEALVAQDPGVATELWSPSTGSLPPRDGAASTDGRVVPAPRERVTRSEQRAGWAPLTIVDRRGEDTGRTGLYSTRVVEAVRDTARAGRRVVCVLNRTGRARLLACRSCGTIAECDVCGAAVHLTDELQLVCDRCGSSRPGVCAECGSSALSSLRIGVTRAREELEALALEPVVALTGRDPSAPNSGRGSGAPGAGDALEGARVVIGTEAALHRVPDPGLVVFLDLDQELLAPRYRASEEALALLVLASRHLGGRDRGGRLMVQTRRPDHEAVQAALRADPLPVTAAEVERRRLVRFPPAATVVMVGGEAAPAYIERVGQREGIEVMGPDDGRWLVRSADQELLLDHLATIERPPGRLRLQVDPARLR